MHGSKAESGDNAEDIPHRLTAKVAGPAIAAGAISLGLVLIGACGLGQHDVYVAPPPISADGHVATGTRAANSASPTYVVVIPPSPSWHIAAKTTPRHTSTTSPFPSHPGDTPTSDPFATTTTDPFDEQSFDTPTYTTPPTSTTDPFDEQDTTTTEVTTEPRSPHHRLPSEEGDN
ncbi:hypothetical protein [Nocardia macrotermitis]|uniref:Uncharacterized protein n=1 Tax=Nocardia macrotermitis TaxID=2585198 RepID=A0A7K0D2L6_9NOCA|nr:hypothetical protein [Nocardia macrotermitis]MQY19955.1 hypothetical protein [Nocardia macrotermitis]